MRKKVVYNLIILFILIITIIASLSLGRYGMSLKRIFDTIIGNGNSDESLVIFTFRLPRIILALLVGLGMGISGVVMQDLLHNDLASPGTLGISAGSGVFITIYVAFFKNYTSKAYFLPIVALLGGILSSLIIFLFTFRKNKNFSPTKLIMVGISISSLYGAISLFLSVILDKSKLEFIQRWQAGELWGTQWKYVIIFAVWLILFISILYLNSKTLNVINIGYDFAANLGINVKKSFIFLAILAVGISSSSVAFGGNFFFLGLIGPHIARKIVGTNAKVLIPASGMVSSIIVLISDTFVRSTNLFVNIPTGIIISILSVPYFLFLLMRR